MLAVGDGRLRPASPLLGVEYVEQVVAEHPCHGNHWRTITEERGFTRAILDAEIEHCLLDVDITLGYHC